jgi:hypothetical protein
MRFVTMVSCALAIASGQAEAQDGTLRPSQCRAGIKATLMVHGHNAPPFPVVLSTLDGNAQNARWHLVPVGDQFGIVSFLTQYGTVAITSAGNSAAVVASPWNGSAQQLWRVTTEGRSSTFASGSSSLYLKTGDQCRLSQPLVLGPESGNLSWVWN